jgi:hypothetical protein
MNVYAPQRRKSRSTYFWPTIPLVQFTKKNVPEVTLIGQTSRCIVGGSVYCVYVLFHMLEEENRRQHAEILELHERLEATKKAHKAARDSRYQWRRIAQTEIAKMKKMVSVFFELIPQLKNDFSPTPLKVLLHRIFSLQIRRCP